MYIDGVITPDEWDDTDTSAAGFRDALKSLGDVKTINLHINSPGGSVFDGIAIYNMLKQSKAKVNIYIDALAASIASVIAMSGDTIFMPANSTLMIHNPYTTVTGNANELRKAADDMDQITKASIVSYLDKAGSKLDEDTLRELMDNETWLTAQEAYDYGLADEILEANKAVACVDKSFAKNFKHLPKQLLQQEPVQKDEEDRIPKEKESGLSASQQKWLKEVRESSRAEREARELEIENIKENSR